MSHVPLSLLDDAGQPTTDFVRGHPCVTLGFKAIPRAGLTPPVELVPVIALIDTGAMQCAVDERLIGAECAPLFRAPHTGITGSTEAPAYEALFDFASIQKTFKTLAFATPLPGGQPWRIVIGRSVLSKFRLMMDKKGGLLILQE